MNLGEEDTRFSFHVQVPDVPDYEPSRLVFRYTAHNRYERCPVLVPVNVPPPVPPSPSLSLSKSLSNRPAPSPPSTSHTLPRPLQSVASSTSSVASSIRPSPPPPRPSLGGASTKASAQEAAKATAAFKASQPKLGCSKLPDIHLGLRMPKLLHPISKPQVLATPPVCSPPDSMKIYMMAAKQQKNGEGERAPAHSVRRQAPRAPPISL